MNSKKLDSLLYKVVQLEMPDEKLNVTGFLQKYEDEYVVKVIDCGYNEHEMDSHIEITEEMIDFVNFSEKPKLMKLDMNSFHYKAVKYVLGDNAPTPNNMQNGCPYFWLMIFSFTVIPFVFIGSMIKKMFIGMANLMEMFFVWLAKVLFENWLESLNATDVAMMNDDHRSVSLPWYVNRYKNGSEDDNYISASEFTFRCWVQDKYGIDPTIDRNKYLGKRKEINSEYVNFLCERDLEDRKLIKKNADRIRKKAAKQEAFNVKYVDPIGRVFNKIGKFVSKLSEFSYDFSTIIKRTKQFFAVIFTFCMFLFYIGLLSIFSSVLMDITDWVKNVWNWDFVAKFGIWLGVVLAAIGILIAIFSWIKNIISKYDLEKKVWYVEVLKYTLYYPIKYVGMGIGGTIWYVICVPVIYVVWKFFIKWFLGGISLWVLSGFKSSGFFGEYVSASYRSLCPGLYWVDSKEEKK